MEFAAGHLVAQLLGGHADPQDVPGAPSATVDFNVVLPEGRVVALEITAAADSDVVAETVAAFGREWKSPELRNNWMIGIGRRVGGDPVPIRDVMAGMMPILALFERNDESTVEVRYSPRYRTKPPEVSNHVHDAMIEMFDLGVEVARVWSSPDPGEDGQIYPTISAGVSSDSAKINALVVERAEKKVDKLRAATADERHLFVWMDHSHADAELAFATLGPPSAPAIPAGVDVVWLVGPTGGPNGVRIWRLEPPGQWAIVPPPEAYSLEL